MWVHAGITASDVISCARRGQHAQGEDHKDASRSSVPSTRPRRNTSACCAGLETRSGHTDTPTRRTEPKRAERAAEALFTSVSVTLPTIGKAAFYRHRSRPGIGLPLYTQPVLRPAGILGPAPLDLVHHRRRRTVTVKTIALVFE